MKILIASSICPLAVEKLQQRHEVAFAINGTEEELCSAIHDREVLVFRSGVEINKQVLSSAGNLKLLVRAGSGLDNLDLAYSRECGIELVRIPEPGARAVAELAFGMMINLARQIRYHDAELRQGHWTKRKTTGYLLNKKVLGIVGVGNIGSCVGQMAVAWGMQVIGCLEDASEDKIRTFQEKGIRICDFEHVVREADFLSIHVPGNPSTRHLINAKVLSWMKSTSFLINLSRGNVVDEAALCDALREGENLAGAGLDVHQKEGEGFVSPLASFPNVLLTPHIGATTMETKREIGERVVDAIESFGSSSHQS